jgi:asparagine synthase (glutamine-hydrolysing)
MIARLVEPIFKSNEQESIRAMSVLVGYWTNSVGTRDLDQLLIKSIGSNTSVELSAEHPHGKASSANAKLATTRFAVKGFGRNVKLDNRSTDDGQQNVTATLAASGKEFAPDIWAKLSTDGLVLGRDTFGRSTLFWTQTTDAVWFSNRLDALLRIVERPTLSVSGFYSYGCFSYVPAPDTPIEGIFSITAGTEMRWNRRGGAPEAQRIHNWHQFDNQIGDEKQAVRSLRRLINDSLETQLESSGDRTIGVFLSGGLDSSLTAALLARSGAKVRAYTLEFSAANYSEVSYAELVANSLGIPLTKIPVTASSFRRELAPTTAALDSLYGDGVTVPLSLLFKRASEEVDIVFNGEGGDQLFAGWTNKPLLAASVYENTDAEHSPDLFVSQYMRTFHRFHGHESGAFTGSVLQLIDKDQPFRVLANALDSTHASSFLHRLRRANLMLKGADNIQPRATTLGLSHGVDVRTIFCSRDLAEWTFSVSDDLFLHRTCEKYLLKLAVSDLLPSEIVWREKRGMGVPMSLWLSGPLRRWWRRELGPRVLDKEGLWQAALPQQIANAEFSGQIQGRRIGEMLWLMLMWRSWRKHTLGLAVESVERRSAFRWQLPLISSSKLKRA